MGCGAGKAKETVGAPRQGAEDVKLDEAQQTRRNSALKQMEACGLNKVEVTGGPVKTEGKGSVRNSQLDFHLPSQTIVIFDWDDTLCPSFWIRDDPRLAWHRKAPKDPAIQEPLEALQAEVRRLLEVAKSLGKVVLVTNAVRPWVSTSIKNFMPNVASDMKDIPICYAQENLERLRKEGFDEQTNCILTGFKEAAMKDVVTDFYTQYPNQSWKNLISIGDGMFEHQAIRQVAAQRPHQNNEKKCRTKTIKLMDNPSVDGLRVEVSLVRCWLQGIVTADADVEIDLNTDDETIEAWHKKYATSQAAAEA